MNDFLSFRKMITPVIIQALFWLGTVICVLSGLIGIIAGARTSFGGGRAVLFGLFLMFVGPVLVRIYCEILIVLFRMNESLTDISNSLKSRPATS